MMADRRVAADIEEQSSSTLTESVARQQGSEISVDGKPTIKCFDFFMEWRKCISAYHQFHQYYIYGQFADCKVEKQRMYNCFKWRGTGKDKFLNAIKTSLEDEQRNMHTPDPVWKLRELPPEDWPKK